MNSSINPEFNPSDLGDEWTSNRLIEELYLNLMSVRTESRRIYYEQAENLIYRIPVYKPTPYFIVELGHLSYKIKKELHSLNDKALDKVMKEAIGKIFENINERYFLLSVKKLLRWEIA